MIDYALKQQNVWSRLAVIMMLTAVEHNETIHYSPYVQWQNSALSSTVTERDRNCRVFGPYCQFLSLFSSSVLSTVSLFLLMFLCVVTPRPAIRHHRCLICSYSLGNPVCLLIPSTSSSSVLPSYFFFFPRSLLSLPVLPVAHLGTNNSETVSNMDRVKKRI